MIKATARFVLHNLGGLAVVRRKHRAQLRILMFHDFPPSSSGNLEILCRNLARHFEPISLSAMIDALEKGAPLPENAVAATVDDGYKSFLETGYPIFRKYSIPVIVYAVAGFSDGRLWLWYDQLQFALDHTARKSIRTTLNGKTFEFSLASGSERRSAWTELASVLITVPNHVRIEFLSDFAKLCAVEIPPDPPAQHAAMTWDDLRAVAADGVEIGCHTDSHPILSRVSEPAELKREIVGARQFMEERLGFPVRHFCYPNGKAADIGDATVAAVRDAGYASAVTAIHGLNERDSNRFYLLRVPCDGLRDTRYDAELLAGLHM